MNASDVASSVGASPKVIVTGCLAQRYGEELTKELPEANMVMGFEKYASLPEELRKLLGTKAQNTTSRTHVSCSLRTVAGFYDSLHLITHTLAVALSQ